jgi:hypothetical protein
LNNEIEVLKWQNKELKQKNGPTKKLEVIISKRDAELEKL